MQAKRKRYAQRRRDLQRVGTRAAKKRLRQMGGRQSRYQKHVNHCISKAIVAKAQRLYQFAKNSLQSGEGTTDEEILRCCPLPPVAERLDELRERLRRERDAERKRRLHLRVLIASGQIRTRQEAAEPLAVHRIAIGQWLKRYAQGGLEALL